MSTGKSKGSTGPKIYFTVTNDLAYDQRMIRICTSLSRAGYFVVLVGREQKASIPLPARPFIQERLYCFFEKGKLFYLEYNIRLFFYLLLKKVDAICAIDLDTILPCYFISRIKRVVRIYDAHELFCEMKEIVSRPVIWKTWKAIEKFTVPSFKLGYTVNDHIAREFKKMYDVNYEVIRNISMLQEIPQQDKTEKFILYQGAVNEGRSFETLIPAMKEVSSKLVICGDGNFMNEARNLVKQHHLENKIIFKGKVNPEQLRTITEESYIGVTLFDGRGLSNYYSLANRFFDYIHAGIPQICVNFPAYREINEAYPVALLVDDLGAENLARQLNNLLNDEVLYQTLRVNCLKARKIFNWQEEEKKLVNFYQKPLPINNG